MRRTPQRDNPLEVAVRSALHRKGFRFRTHYRVLPHRRAAADIAFTRQRLAIFIDGCFWHGCPEHATRPQRNAAWWAAKLDRNVARDRETDAEFEKAGWWILRCWEHEGTDAIVDRIERALVDATRRER
jgi:DNA mismatch endonuclease (patch repair protein)